jgi:hypothetical protein
MHIISSTFKNHKILGCIVVFLVIIIVALAFMYPVFRIISWLAWNWLNNKPIRYLIPVFVSLLHVPLVPFAVWARNHNYSYWRWFLSIVGNFLLNTTMTMIIICIVGEIIGAVGFIVPVPWIVANQWIIAVVVLSLTLLTLILSLINGNTLWIKTLQVRTTLSQSVRVVQLSDVHIGSRTKAFLERVVRKTNALHPDVVVITGDLIDTPSVLFCDSTWDYHLPERKHESHPLLSEHYREHDLEPLRNLNARYGVFFVSVSLFP